MLTSAFIFLCIGLLANCMPTSKPPEHVRKVLNEEIQDHLETILNNSIKAFTMVPSNMMGTIHIPVLTTEEQCAMLRLEVFIKLLYSVKIENEEELNFQKFYRGLQGFARLWSLQEPRSLQECETEEYQYGGLRKVLEDIRRLMKQLYCIQGHC